MGKYTIPEKMRDLLFTVSLFQIVILKRFVYF